LIAGLLHSVTGAWTVPVLAVIAVCGVQMVIGLGAARPGVVSR
jgi:cyanate permease